MEKEIWKDIEGYENTYQVSNLGNVMSLKFGKVRILKPSKDRNDYRQVKLLKDGKTKMFLVHRLVAEAFLPNPHNYPIINHKDENPSNNNVDNLEWCTQQYNVNYGNANESRSNTLKGKNINSPSLSKAVIQYTLDGQFVKEYPSAKEAERQINIKNQNILACCNGYKNHSHAGGYKWCFKSE